jgi:hypothetical protein
MWHAWERREMHMWVSWEYLKERDHMEYHDIDGRIILNCMIKVLDLMVCPALIWLWVGTSDGLL